jgi:DNA-directed RNA polymerase specialized sigma24 family protein
VKPIKTKTKASPAPPKPEPATSTDIRQAFEALTTEESERIWQNARNRIYWVGPRAANGRNADDLIGEAFERILDGRREWDKSRIRFAPYLIGVIWSIASEWAGYRERNKKKNLPEFAALESQLTKPDEEGKEISPFDDLATEDLNPEQALAEAQMMAEREAHSKVFMEKIKAEFAEDGMADLVIAGILDDMDGPAIRAILELSEKEFKATIRRIQRHVKKIMEQQNGGQGA